MSNENRDPESLKSVEENDDIFNGRGEKPLTIKDIKKNIEKLMEKVNLSDITKPDCENKYLHTGTICTAYIVFVIVSILGLIGIFIWKFCRSKKNESSEYSPLINTKED